MQKSEKSKVRPAFGVRSTQTLVQIYNRRGEMNLPLNLDAFVPDIIKRQTYFLLSWDRTELGESSKVDFRLASSDFLPKSQESFRKLASPVNH